jgi:fused signal recognition particle receptor
MFGFGKKKQQTAEAAAPQTPELPPGAGAASAPVEPVAQVAATETPVLPGPPADETSVRPRGLFARLGFGRQRPAEELGWVPGLALPPTTEAPAESAAAPWAEAIPAATAPGEPALEASAGRAATEGLVEPSVIEAHALPLPGDDAETPEVKQGLFKRLSERLSRSRTQLGTGLGNLFLGRKRIDDDLLEELETLLLTADVGVDATGRIIADLTARVRRKSLADPQALLAALKQALREILLKAHDRARAAAPGRSQVILMVGVNGAGKTTTIGKLAKLLQVEGNSVMLAAGDTFRAAAVEQLQTWGERNRVPVIAQKGGADAASVIFDALQAATARGIDVLIADTAGRLHTKTNLMDELVKIVRVMRKIDPDAPHEVMLVVDATTGQNALNQAVQFHQAVGLTGIALTKLDGTAKGGIVFAIAERLQVPIRFIGVGESIEDLRPFDADEFLDALLT